MAHPLDGCRPKVKRANKHIADLQSEITRHFRSKPYKLRSKYDAAHGHLVVYLADCKEPSLETSILIGEALQQLRSALDYLVARLIIRNGQQPPAHNGFPVFCTAKGYEARKNAMIKGVPLSAEARIERLQPYHRGARFKNHPLWILRDLNDSDKHRAPIAAPPLMGPDLVNTIEFTPSVSVRHGAFMKVVVLTSMEDGAELFRIETPNRKVKVKGKFPVTVTFEQVGDAKDQPVVPLLKQLSDFVGRTIESFAPDF